MTSRSSSIWRKAVAGGPWHPSTRMLLPLAGGLGTAPALRDPGLSWWSHTGLRVSRTRVGELRPVARQLCQTCRLVPPGAPGEGGCARWCAYCPPLLLCHEAGGDTTAELPRPQSPECWPSGLLQKTFLCPCLRPQNTSQPQ